MLQLVNFVTFAIISNHYNTTEFASLPLIKYLDFIQNFLKYERNIYDVFTISYREGDKLSKQIIKLDN